MQHAFVEYKDIAISQPLSVMESSLQLNSKSQSDPTDSFPSLPKLLSQLESSSSIDSLTLEVSLHFKVFLFCLLLKLIIY